MLDCFYVVKQRRFSWKLWLLQGQDIVYFYDYRIIYVVTTIRQNFIVLNFELFVILFIVLVLVSSRWEHGEETLN